MREVPVSKPDRRQFPRTKLVEIAYIGMGPENGGLVLDVSDGGLSFHAVAPVHQAETIRFLLSLRGYSRIEGAGEVVWTNEVGTVCGLKFTSLSSGAREHLNNWTNQSNAPAPARSEPVSTAPPALDTPPPPVVTAPPASREVEAPRTEEPPPAALAGQSESTQEPLFAIPPASEFFLAEPAPQAVWAGRIFLWIAVGLLGALLVGSAYLYGVRVGQAEANLPARPAAVPETPAEPPATAAAPPSAAAAPAPAAAPAAPSAAAEAIPSAANSSAGNSLVNTSRAVDASAQGTLTTEQQKEQAIDAGKSQLAAALAYLNGTNGPRDSATAAKQLWAAVGNGNSDAEIILAGLYANGDGVVKSCVQGRVLLIAAVKSGNPQAQAKLNELNANGCP